MPCGRWCLHEPFLRGRPPLWNPPPGHPAVHWPHPHLHRVQAAPALRRQHLRGQARPLLLHRRRHRAGLSRQALPVPAARRPRAVPGPIQMLFQGIPAVSRGRCRAAGRPGPRVPAGPQVQSLRGSPGHHSQPAAASVLLGQRAFGACPWPQTFCGCACGARRGLFQPSPRRLRLSSLLPCLLPLFWNTRPYTRHGGPGAPRRS